MRTGWVGMALVVLGGCGPSAPGAQGPGTPAPHGVVAVVTEPRAVAYPAPAAPPGGGGGGGGGSGSGGGAAGGSTDAGNPGPLRLVAATFNTGIHDRDPNDNFSGSNARIIEEYYGSGLAWNPAIQDVKAWLASVSPDVIGMQELFDPEECPNIPADKKNGFVCAAWQVGDPAVAEMILGPGYQIACNVGHHDNCLAVKRSFGSFRGCSSALCRDGLGGVRLTNCGQGTRVGRGVIDLVQGGTLTVVSIHASAGFTTKEFGCRTQQFAQVFTNLDGAPAANGARNLIIGDFNTDPARLIALDPSAQALAGHVTGQPFHFVTPVGLTVTPTYDVSLVPFLPVGFNVDLIVSDRLNGTCWVAGQGGRSPPSSTDYFDHKPIVCNVSE